MKMNERKSTAIFWFKQDLRCEDNPALTLACANHDHIIPLYIKEESPVLPMGGAQLWWLHHSLTALKKKLNEVQLELYLRQANPLILLQSLVKEYEVDTVYWNRCYEPMHIERDKAIKAALVQQGVRVVSCNGSLLQEPWEVKNQSGQYFKVFTPYWRHCLRTYEARPLEHITHWPNKVDIPSDELCDWNLLPTKPNWAKAFPAHWQPGEEGAAANLTHFIEFTLSDYKEWRNEPGRLGTSKLSPHLHFGEISPQQIWDAVQKAKNDPSCNLASADHFLSELGWREFSYHLLYHFPQLMESNFKSQFDKFPWQKDDNALKAWQQGLTGYPIVDAGMRELWQTGYMHNRVRMIVASFLTKHLLIDWRLGAAWFWDTLVDADLANNSASWQWVAGSGADAAPYYRIFNPVLQGEKFDPQGEYTKRWIPELAKVPSKWLHKPWEASQNELPIRLGIDYPLPIVDHAKAREEALSRYKQC